MVLIGVGAIGARTAQIANALGMRVLGVRRNPEIQEAGVESMFSPCGFEGCFIHGRFCGAHRPFNTGN